MHEMMEEDLRFLYDREADVFYVAAGHPEHTDYVELDDDFILRIDPQTKKVVGFTIVDFAAHFAQREPPLSAPLKAEFEQV